MKAAGLIKEARRRAGLTQAELAARLGTAQSVVARWESGARTPSLDTIEKVARACDLDVSVALVGHDTHDLGLALGTRRLSPGQRIEYAVAAQNKLRRLRGGARAGGGG